MLWYFIAVGSGQQQEEQVEARKKVLQDAKTGGEAQQRWLSLVVDCVEKSE